MKQFADMNPSDITDLSEHLKHCLIKYLQEKGYEPIARCEDYDLEWEIHEALLKTWIEL